MLVLLTIITVISINMLILVLLTHITVSFHNFKLQNLKLSVSNPKNKYVDYLSVLSQISNCQGLGRNNKHEILKTDRETTGYVTIHYTIRYTIHFTIHYTIL